MYPLALPELHVKFLDIRFRHVTHRVLGAAAGHGIVGHLVDITQKFFLADTSRGQGRRLKICRQGVQRIQELLSRSLIIILSGGDSDLTAQLAKAVIGTGDSLA